MNVAALASFSCKALLPASVSLYKGWHEAIVADLHETQNKGITA
ncbi:hypothetical protein [Nostoc sp.]